MDAARSAKGPRPRSVAMKLPAGEAAASQSGLLGKAVLTSSCCRGSLPLVRRRGVDGVCAGGKRASMIATRVMAGRGLAAAQSAYALMSAASRIQYRMACHHLRSHADRQARPSQEDPQRPLALLSGCSIQLCHDLLRGRRGRQRQASHRPRPPLLRIGTVRHLAPLAHADMRPSPPSRAGTPPTSSRRPSRRRAASAR